jgi:hypothetical protein
MKTNKLLFAAIGLIDSPTTELGPSQYAILITVDTDLKKVINLARRAELGALYAPGNYIAVYETKAGIDLRLDKNHRIGDDLESEHSPIIFTRHRTSEGCWTERWFDDRARFQVEPGLLVSYK